MKRRSFLTLLTGIIAAPAIVKIANIMPVKVWVEPEVFEPGTILGSSKHLNGFLAFLCNTSQRRRGSSIGRSKRYEEPGVPLSRVGRGGAVHGRFAPRPCSEGSASQFHR